MDALKEAKSLLKLRKTNLKETLTLIERNPGVDIFLAQKVDLEAEIASLKAHVDRLTPRPAPMVVAVDPAMVRNGFAFRVKGQRVSYGVLEGIENLSAGNAAKVAKGLDPKATVYLMIEYPTWKGRGTDAVRAAANCWIRAMKTAFPRRLKIRKVTPQTWMKEMIPGWRKVEKPADLYIPLAQDYAEGGDRSLAIDENAAAAVCLLAYAEQLIQAGEFDAQPQKKAGRKAPAMEEAA